MPHSPGKFGGQSSARRMDLGIHIDRGEFTISGGFVPKRTGFWGMMYRARADLTMLLEGLLIVAAGRSKEDAEFRHGGPTVGRRHDHTSRANDRCGDIRVDDPGRCAIRPAAPAATC